MNKERKEGLSFIRGPQISSSASSSPSSTSSLSSSPSGPLSPERRKNNVTFHEHQDSQLLLLSNEVIFMMLSYLSPKDLCRCAMVCKRLRELSEDNFLWKKYGHSHRVFEDERLTYKKIYSNHSRTLSKLMMSSPADLVELLEPLLNRSFVLPKIFLEVCGELPLETQANSVDNLMVVFTAANSAPSLLFYQISTEVRADRSSTLLFRHTSFVPKMLRAIFRLKCCNDWLVATVAPHILKYSKKYRSAKHIPDKILEKYADKILNSFISNFSSLPLMVRRISIHVYREVNMKHGREEALKFVSSIIFFRYLLPFITDRYIPISSQNIQIDEEGRRGLTVISKWIQDASWPRPDYSNNSQNNTNNPPNASPQNPQNNNAGATSLPRMRNDKLTSRYQALLKDLAIKAITEDEGMYITEITSPEISRATLTKALIRLVFIFLNANDLFIDAINNAAFIPDEAKETYRRFFDKQRLEYWVYLLSSPDALL